MECPLCVCSEQSAYYNDFKRSYLRCTQCQLVFVEPSQRLEPAAERAEYALHQNSPEDLGYRRFLSRLMDPLLPLLQPQSQGLDFGCGPGPTLSVMLEEHGHTVALYDVFFYPDRSVLDQAFDFITATEVVEHLHAPGAVLTDLFQRLKPGGLLGIMTKRVRSRDAFANWHYKNDPTHVCFFHEDSFTWLAQHLNATLNIIGDDVVILQRPH